MLWRRAHAWHGSAHRSLLEAPRRGGIRPIAIGRLAYENRPTNGTSCLEQILVERLPDRAEGAPRPAMPEPKILHKRKPISQLPAPASGSFDPFGTDGVKAPELPPLRFGLGDAVKCNMGKDGYQEC